MLNHIQVNLKHVNPLKTEIIFMILIFSSDKLGGSAYNGLTLTEYSLEALLRGGFLWIRRRGGGSYGILKEKSLIFTTENTKS